MSHFDARLLAGMTNLISLNLAGNELRMIPQQIELVQSLERLSLENNLILKIPFVMERLTNLRVLRLHGNLIKTIPLNLAHLPNLVDFTAANQREAQVQGVDQGIISAEKYCIDNRQPSLAVYAWLKRTAEGSMIINRCKLLLVGDANVGKSTFFPYIHVVDVENNPFLISRLFRSLHGQIFGVVCQGSSPHGHPQG